MRNIDEKFKDATPLETVQRARDILASRGIKTIEHLYTSGVKNCYSLGVRIEGTQMNTNGKGVSEELAKASGYGEMMERLQSGWLTKDWLQYKDARRFDRAQLREACGRWLADIAASATQREKKTITVDMLVDQCFAAEGNGDTVEVLPYYNVIDDCMTWFPRAISENLYNTNGLAAGNSPEEAMVQGFSEIFERRYRFPFFLGESVPPTIPEEYLKQFPNSYAIIENLRAQGKDVVIKDCSCGLKFPLIASVVIDKANSSYTIHMGASPVFEIALGRSLTEMFQGINVDRALTHSSFYTGKKGYRGASEILGLLVRGLGIYPLDFIAEEPSYPFEPFPAHESSSNAELLAWIVRFVKESGRRLLVRDLSHFGFCDFQIIVPGLSEVVYSELAEPLPLYTMEHPRTKYVTFYGGDYDSAAWLKLHVMNFWQDPARGTLPINWAFNPNLSERAPMVFDYIHENLTDNDFFSAGDTGAGYVIPAALYESCSLRELPDGSKAWAEHCAYYYDKFDLDNTGFIINGHYPMTTEIMKTFSEFSPVGNFHNCPATLMASYNGVPFVYLHNGVSGKINSYEGSAQAMYNHIFGRMKDYNFAGFRNVCDSPSDTKRLVERFLEYAKEKNPDYDYEYVDTYTFFDLLHQSGQCKEGL